MKAFLITLILALLSVILGRMHHCPRSRKYYLPVTKSECKKHKSDGCKKHAFVDDTQDSTFYYCCCDNQDFKLYTSMYTRMKGTMDERNYRNDGYGNEL
jgi:hypothetical protein